MKRRAQPWLGTIVEIAIADDLESSMLHQAYQVGFDAIRQVHQLMSFHSEQSDVTRINLASVGSILEVDAHTFKVLETARTIYTSSEGLFNVCNAQLLVEWGYLPFESARDMSNWRANQMTYRTLSNGQVEKTQDGLIDLGGIAKGYAVDYAISKLIEFGVHSAIVNAGGDLRVIGNDAINVHIRNPQKPQCIKHQVTLKNKALASSGSYFSQRQFADQNISALIDSTTGKAIVSQSSFSVMAQECILADALTKVLAICGDITHPCFDEFNAKAFIT